MRWARKAPEGYRIEQQLFDVRGYDGQGDVRVIADHLSDHFYQRLWVQWYREKCKLKRPVEDLRKERED